MAISLLSKSITGVLGLGTATVGAVYFGRDLIGNKAKISIEELIDTSNPDKRFISASSDTYWREAWKAYIEDNKSNEKDVWNVAGWTSGTTVTNNENAPSEFIQACDNKRSQKVLDKNDSLYSQVVKYCTRDTVVRDLINETEGRSLLVKNGDFATDSHWRAAWKLYRDDNPDGSDKWNISNYTSIKSQENAQEAFAKMCEEKSQVKEHDLTKSTYLDVLKYCTKVG
ncbi:hypothetical protein MHC_01045 [Mycoplasma haemocanis str. Illinois]|uniref:Uncharacterized protein n=1 Tax=Mycoplasma haemocanis (strain Illinois) TaxID=1111676 RepID=H6N603_MYCHN|nr:hypothetical protein [Mycoplasma haemocanis]AEW45075.1 hypothetical protein MHC_01045 [Mycoplasma haemocanis str. Illinois]